MLLARGRWVDQTIVDQVSVCITRMQSSRIDDSVAYCLSCRINEIELRLLLLVLLYSCTDGLDNIDQVDPHSSSSRLKYGNEQSHL